MMRLLQLDTFEVKEKAIQCKKIEAPTRLGKENARKLPLRPPPPHSPFGPLPKLETPSLP